MATKEELQKQLEALEDQSKPIQKELNEIYKKEIEEVELKLKRCDQGIDRFDSTELIYAAHSRCLCGAGFAYPKNIGIQGAWYCSAILTGDADAGTSHSSPLPFAFYEVKSENQPSAKGATTRK